MMSLAQAAQVLNGRLVPAAGGASDVTFTAVSTDSRAISAGDLFIALRGDNFDGGKFVAAAARDGAVAALVNADGFQDDAPPCPVLLVDDTRLALGRLAAHWRAQFALLLVALTGSNGKTTVKEMLASILRDAVGDADAVLATQGNFNNDIGMPLTLLRLRATHRYAVIEMGMNHAGEIDYLTRIARPDVALINNAAGAHLAGLGSLEAVARAKGEIFAGLSRDGIAVINADDAYAPLWRELAEGRRVVDFTLSRRAGLAPRGEDAEFAPRGASPALQGHWQVADTGGQLDVEVSGGAFSARLQVPGEHNARNALAAAAAAIALGIPLTHIATGLEQFGGVSGRLQRQPARQGATLIDDTYNANPASMRAALSVLAQMPGKRIFVMGDMGELGADALRLHAEIGAEARELGVQCLLALGELSRAAADEFGAGAQHFEDVESLCAALDAELDANTTVLVKGSRYMKMERVVRRFEECKEATCC